MSGGTADPAAWRGVAAEQVEEVSAPLAALLRDRSRALLGAMLRPHRRSVAAVITLIVTAALTALAGPWLIGLAIDDGIPPLVRSGDAVPLAVIAASFGAAALIQAAATRWYVALTGIVGQAMVLELRRRLFRHCLELDVAFCEDYTSGRVISRQTSDIEAISVLFEEGLDSLISAVLTVLLVGTSMLLLCWQLGLVVLTGFVPLLWLTAWYRRQSAAAYRHTREAMAMVIVHFVETFGGIRAVQAFRREPRNNELFSGLAGDYAVASRRASRLIAVYGPSIRLTGNLLTGIILAIGGLLAIDGSLQVGVLATFVLYLGRFFHPLQDVAQFYNSFQSAASGLEKISGLLEQEPAVPEPRPDDIRSLPPAGSGPAGGAAPGTVAGAASGAAPGAAPGVLADAVPDAGRRVRFEGVRFGYRETVVLPDLNLDIPPGQTVALVGETGAGKTTIARLLGRFYDPGEGVVSLDGVPLPLLTDAELRREVMVITQENFLFQGTVADNIAMGRPGATRAEVRQAAAAIGADGFIEALPEGYDTPVGKRGGRLSAGQRQLISFARVFLAAPSVLVLDEATSLLDIPTERVVQRALGTVLAGRTAMIIAHRLSTVAIADRVLVLSAGQVTEDGPPALVSAWAGALA